jgi:nicotinamide riboside kinase
MHGMPKVRRVNLVGGPGAGKSTSAAGIFYHLKTLHRDVELVQEYVKSWAYEQRAVNIGDQNHIFNKQQRREIIPLRAGVELVITDSPLTLSGCYAKKSMPKDWELLMLLAKAHERDYPSINIFLTRDDKIPYQKLGRYQTKEQALEMDDVIWSTLTAFDIPLIPIKMTDLDKMLLTIMTELGKCSD